MSNTESLSLAQFLSYFPSPIGCLGCLAVLVALHLPWGRLRRRRPADVG